MRSKRMKKKLGEEEGKSEKGRRETGEGENVKKETER